MKDYTSKKPAFEKTIQVVETTDPAHADNLNVPVKQLLQNTLVNHNFINLLIGFVYDSDSEKIISALPATYENEKIVFLDEMAAVDEDEEKLILTVD